MTEKLSLKNLIVANKETDAEFPGMPGFVIRVGFLTKETLQKIRKKSTKTMFKNRQMQEEIDDDIFMQAYTDAAIKGWKGLKLSYLDKLAPVDLSGQDMDSELTYSQENAVFLLKNSTDFDSFISETVTTIANFPSNSK